MMNMRKTRLAADIGGTFTDVVLESGSRSFSTKVLTTSQAPELGVMEGLEEVLEQSGTEADEVALFIHGTTLGTNALIERKGAKIAFLTTEGFRDILEMGHEKRFEQYDIYMDKPTPLVPRPLRFPVTERMSARGETLLALDESGLLKTIAQLKHVEIEAVAVGLLHAYAHPAHEQRIREILATELPEVTICLSSEVCPEMREYERFSTTCANAYIRPLMSGYLQRLQVLAQERGMSCPLLLMMSGGGLTTLENATTFPIRLVESGPAGGAILAGKVALECGVTDALSFDMGGTTAKICLIENGVPERSRHFEVARMYRNLKGSGLPVRIPVIEMVEIGAGGGSIAQVDEMGRIQVGPESAGSEPGPACYGRGGLHATVTDANLALGKLDPERFAGGKIALDSSKSEVVLAQEIGGKLGLERHWPATGVVEIVEENMVNAARVHAIERGKVIGRHTMIAFGGGAPLHAGRLAQKLGISKVVIPFGAGVGSAIGFLRAPISYEVVRSLMMEFRAFDAFQVNQLLEVMSAEARGVVAQGVTGSKDFLEKRVVELRYLGQGHELRIPLPERLLELKDAEALRGQFEEQYETIYGLRIPDMEVQSVSWSVTVTTKPDAPEKATDGVPNTSAIPLHHRKVYDSFSGEQVECPVYWRFDLNPGTRFSGPAVIAEEETTTIVPGHFSASINSLGHIVMETLPLEHENG